MNTCPMNGVLAGCLGSKVCKGASAAMGEVMHATGRTGLLHVERERLMGVQARPLRSWQ